MSPRGASRHFGATLKRTLRQALLKSAYGPKLQSGVGQSTPALLPQFGAIRGYPLLRYQPFDHFGVRQVQIAPHRHALDTTFSWSAHSSLLRAAEGGPVEVNTFVREQPRSDYAMRRAALYKYAANVSHGSHKQSA